MIPPRPPLAAPLPKDLNHFLSELGLLSYLSVCVTALSRRACRASLSTPAPPRSFEEEEVDIETLKLLSEQDFADMGLPMGPRKRIMLRLKHAT